jgi:hypothetical protein
VSGVVSYVVPDIGVAHIVSHVGVPGVNPAYPAKYEGHYREDKPEQEER